MKLCELLDDNTEDMPVVVDKNAPPNTKNLKILYFQMEQRVNDLEKRLDEFHEMPLETMGLMPDEPNQMKEGSQIKEPLTIPKGRQSEISEMKSIIMKYEMYLNDANIRISELEAGMKKIDPNHLRMIIQDVAELAMKKQTIEVNTTVDGLKENRMRDIQLIEGLKQNLKEMNNRFMIDIERKVEVKDLKITKNQLRKRVRCKLP